ncbi:katanin p80 WD40 repeat-containing subunit B1 [Lytechinus variegatus]|uniref:katanin p80 WD40 repeat-containing subunit B1 n=1 Tax=Lytechinus variegatus TaxID=7654 RepID=UPI001BB2A132|nr:katanin p80 WD40 repeat-containing subunit B1 [Lytechinus variegatus]
MATKRAWKLQELVAHSGNVNCLALGPRSGRVMVTGGDDKKVNLWAVGKQNCIISLSGHTSSVESVKFNDSEELVVAGSQSGTMKIYDLEKAKGVRTLTGHRNSIKCIDFHPYGEFVASGSIDTNVKLWDVRRGGCIYTYKGHSDQVNMIKFSPDGKWLVTASEDKTIKLWDLTMGKLFQEFKNHTGGVTGIEFHPNEFLLASGSADKTVQFWDLETFQLVSSTSAGASAVRTISFHPDGSYLFCGSQDMLHAFGWEPIRCFDTFSMGWGKVADTIIASTQLIGASFNATNVSVYVADLSRMSTTGLAQEPLSQPSKAPSAKEEVPSKPLTASGRKNFVRERPHTTSSKQRQPDMKSEPERQSPTQDEGGAKDDDATDIKDPDSYAKIFSAKSRVDRSPERSAQPFPAPLDVPGAQEPQPVKHQPQPAAAAVAPASRAPAPSANDWQPAHANVAPSRVPAATKPVPAQEVAPSSRPDPASTIIPSDRNKPANLDMNAFLPPANANKAPDVNAPSSRKPSDSERMEGLRNGHKSMCQVLSSRHRNLDIIRAIWSEGDTKTSVQSAVNMKDQAILVDILNIMLLKKSLWNLDMCVVTLPSLKDLLSSKYENYVHTSCACLKLILKNFTGLINQNIKCPPSGIDITREERYNKCSKCYNYLIATRGYVEDKQHVSGKLGSTFRELHLLLAQLE